MPNFDYENAKRDILDNGGDPDYLSETNEKDRDAYLRKMGLDPSEYGRTSEQSGSGKRSGCSGGSSSDDWSIFGGGSSSGSSGSSGDSCYLTTACVRAKGLADDCPELTEMRRFRDTYVLQRKDGREDVATYYRLAPQVVRRINSRPDAEEIWKKVYENMVLPCLEHIRRGENEQAYRMYKTCTLALADLPD